MKKLLLLDMTGNADIDRLRGQGWAIVEIPGDCQMLSEKMFEEMLKGAGLTFPVKRKLMEIYRARN